MRYDRFKNTFQNILSHYIYIMFSCYIKDEPKWEHSESDGLFKTSLFQ